MCLKTILLTIVIFFAFIGANGAQKIWSGNGGNGNLSNPANWTDNIAPVTDDDLIFFSSPNTHVLINDYDSAMIFGSLLFSEGYIINGNDVRLNGIITANRSATFNASVIIVGSASELRSSNGSGSTYSQVSIGTNNLVLVGLGSLTVSNLSGSGQVSNRGGGSFFINGGSGFTGSFGVSSGTVIINSDFPSSNVVVSGGTLTGAGRVNQLTNAGGTVSPYSGTPAIFNTGNLNLSLGNYHPYVLGTTAGTANGYAQLNVTGTVTLGPQALSIISFGVVSIPTGSIITLINNDGTDPVVNTFGFYPEGRRFLVNGNLFRISYIGGTGNDVTLTRVAQSPFDFDGDGKSDISISRANGANREWWIQRSSNLAPSAAFFGLPTDRITPADFTGDGKTDITVWRPTTGEWFALRSEDNTFFGFPFGTNGDIPIPADYDGDGKADAAVFRPSIATWFVNKSGGGTLIQQFGIQTDAPVPSDYDGDGKADIAVYRANGASQEWWVQRSSNNTYFAAVFGSTGDKAVQGDYTGDGKIDIAVWRPANGNWYVLRSEDFSFYSFPFGTNDDIPTPGDYDGDGKFDSAVWRPGSGTWFLNESTAGNQFFTFGAASDQPLANAYVR